MLRTVNVESTPARLAFAHLSRMANAREFTRAAELKAEARRSVASGDYFGHIAYTNLVGRKSS